MLNLIYGRVGSGKTTIANEIIANLARSGNENMLLVVPEQFSFTSERTMLDLLGPVDCNRVEIVTSFTHIYDTVKKTHGSDRLKELDDGQKAMLMNLAISSVSDRFVFFARQKKSMGLITEMIKLSDEFKHNCLSTKDVQNVLCTMDKSILKDKLSEVSLIISAYDALVENRFYDPGDRLTRLYDILGEFEFFKDKVIVLDAFHGYSAQEIKIIERMLEQAENVYITVCTDEIYNDDEEYGVFSYTKKNIKKLVDAAKRHDVRIKTIFADATESEKNRSGEITFFEKNIYRPDFSVYEDATQDITVCKAKNIREECKYVASEVKRLIKNGMRCREIAVISRSGEEYDDEIKSELKKYDISVFSDRLQEIKTQPLCVFISSALEIAVYGFSQERIMRCTKSGLFSVSGEELAKLENYAILWQIEGEKWLNEFTENPSGMGSALLDKNAEDLKEINLLREKIISPLSQFREIIKTNPDGEGTATAVYELLKNIGADENLKMTAINLEENGETELALEQEKIWDTVMEILNDIAVVIGKVHLACEEIMNLFNTVVSAKKIGKIPQGIDEVLVGNAERTRASSPKAVFVVGANAGVFPSVPSDNGILSGKERTTLISAGFEIDDKLEMKMLEERFIAYHAFCSAREKLFVSYSSTDLGGEVLYPSEIVNQILNIFPQCKQVDTDKTDSFEYIGSVQTAFETLALRWKTDDEKTVALKEYFSDKDNYSGKINAFENAENQCDFKIENLKTAEKLFGKNMYLSASKIEDYYNCAFRYFCRYGLKAFPREIASLDPRQRGTVIHYCLETLLREYEIDELKNADEKELKNIITKILTDYASEFMGGFESKSKRFYFLYRRFESIVFELISQIIEEFSQSKFRPSDFELRIDKDGEIPLYVIPLDDGGEIRIHGMVDRVDTMELYGKTCVRVVDYKTGSKTFHLSDVLQGINLQMFVYLFSIWKNGEKKYGDIIPAGVLYKPAKVVMRNASRNENDVDREKEKIKTSKSFGAVLNNVEVIEGMEKEVEEKYVNVKYKVKDDDKTKCVFSGDVISLAQLGELNKVIDGLIKEMGKELHNGNIKAFPTRHDNKTLCEFCDYSDICMHNEKSPERELTNIKHDEVLALLDNGGEENE